MVIQRYPAVLQRYRTVLSRYFSGTKEGTERYFGGTLRYFRGTPTVPFGITITVNGTFVEFFLTRTVYMYTW